MEFKDVVPFMSAVFGGTLVALLNFTLGKKKTEAEIAKIQAETNKINTEAKSLQSKVENVESGQQLQKDVLHNIQNFLVKHFLTESERRHLEQLSTGVFWPFQQNETTPFFLNELRNLRSMGLIIGHKYKGTRSLEEEGGDINSHFMITPDGRDYLDFLKKID
jgi:hypothetical protein